MQALNCLKDESYMNTEIDNKEKDYLAEATKKAFQGKPMSDKSIDNAFSIYREKKAQTGEGIPENKQAVLALSKSVMKCNIFRKRRRRRIVHISLGSTFAAFAVIILICILSLRTPTKPNEPSWKSSLTIAHVDYTSLDEEESISIQQINQDYKAEFYWLDNMEKTNTSFFYNRKELVLMEESYLYNNISCTLYIMNNNTIISGMRLDYNLENTYNLNINGIFIYTKKQNTFHQCVFNSNYKYFLIIDSIDSTVVEPILSSINKN